MNKFLFSIILIILVVGMMACQPQEIVDSNSIPKVSTFKEYQNATLDRLNHYNSGSYEVIETNVIDEFNEDNYMELPEIKNSIAKDPEKVEKLKWAMSLKKKEFLDNGVDKLYSITWTNDRDKEDFYSFNRELFKENYGEELYDYVSNLSVEDASCQFFTEENIEMLKALDKKWFPDNYVEKRIKESPQFRQAAPADGQLPEVLQTVYCVLWAGTKVIENELDNSIITPIAFSLLFTLCMAGGDL